MRKFWLHVETVYQVFNTIFAWFSLVSVTYHMLSWTVLIKFQANYYIAFTILSQAM